MTAGHHFACYVHASHATILQQKHCTSIHDTVATKHREGQHSAVRITEVGCWCAGNSSIFAATTLLPKPVIRSAQIHSDMHFSGLYSHSCQSHARLSSPFPHHLNSSWLMITFALFFCKQNQCSPAVQLFWCQYKHQPHSAANDFARNNITLPSLWHAAATAIPQI